MKIRLFKTNSVKDIPRMLNMDTLQDIADWVSKLPKTKRGADPYRLCTANGPNKEVPFIVFVRREDAVAFRLKFGL